MKGIERADSVVWDAHKMMLMPALVTAVLFRDAARSFDAFAQEASYLFHGEDTRPWSDVGLRTLECTKEMMALKLYTCLKPAGHAPLRGLRDGSPSSWRAASPQTLQASRGLRAGGAPGLQHRLLPPHARGACPPPSWTRSRPACASGSSPGGDFYLVQTTLPGRGVYLRTTLINPLTPDADLDALLDALRRAV